MTNMTHALPMLALIAAVAVPLPAMAAGKTVGERAPDSLLHEPVSGKPVRFAAAVAESRYTVVVFHSSRCTYSRAYDERLSSLARELAPQGIQVMAINSNTDEPEMEVRGTAAALDLPFTVLKDRQQILANAFGARTNPEFFVLDSERRIVYHGRMDDSPADAANVQSPDLRNALGALLADDVIANDRTQAVGCAIARR